MKRSSTRLVFSTLLLSVTLVAGSASVIASSHPDPLTQAVEAIGGEDALNGLEHFQITATGARWLDYESPQPGGLMDSNNYAKTYTFDVPAGQLRVDTERQLLFEAIAFTPPQDFSVVLDGDVGGLTGSPGVFGPSVPTIPSQGVASLRKQQMLFNPQLILRAALADPASAGDGGTADYDGRSHRILTIADDIAEIRLLIDEETGLISKLETMENSPIVRDYPLEVRYGDWQSAGSLSFPNSVQLYASGLLVQDETRTSVELEPTLPDDHFALPAEVDMSAVDAELLAYGAQTSGQVEAFFGSFGAFYGPQGGLAPAAEIAPGLTLLGSGANTLLVETTDGIIVIEAPTSPDHGSAIVSATNELFPDSPITHIIQSHDDVDHASGVRSIVAAGATAVVGSGAADFWAQVLSADSTIRPDALATAGVSGVVEELEAGGSLTVADDGDISVTVYHVANPHSNDMVITAIETDGQLYVYEADLYNAGFGGTLVLGGPASFFDALRDFGLIDASCASAVPLTIIPAHGIPQSLEDSITELGGQSQEIGC